MGQNRGYLIMELAVVTTLNTLFLTFFLSNQAKLRHEECNGAQKMRMISQLVTAIDQRVVHGTFDTTIQISESKTSAPRITGSAKPPFDCKRSFPIYLFTLRDQCQTLALCTIEPIVQEHT